MKTPKQCLIPNSAEGVINSLKPALLYNTTTNTTYQHIYAAKHCNSVKHF